MKEAGTKQRAKILTVFRDNADPLTPETLAKVPFMTPKGSAKTVPVLNSEYIITHYDSDHDILLIMLIGIW